MGSIINQQQLQEMKEERKESNEIEALKKRTVEKEVAIEDLL